MASAAVVVASRALRIAARGLSHLDQATRRSGARPVINASLARLARRPRVVDVGAQTLRHERHVYAPLAAVTPIDLIGFDPLEERILERTAQDGAGVTLLPYALGDGNDHTLYVNNDDEASSLFPLDTDHNAQFEHLHTLRTVNTVPVATRRLDDVLQRGPVDFLKLDVQGAELMVLRGGRETTARTAVVHCEVEFSPIYVDQPLYADVEHELRQHGFYLVDLLVRHRYAYHGVSRTSDRLLWADAVFFRESDESNVRAAQALIAASIYGKLSLAEHLLTGLDARNS